MQKSGFFIVIPRRFLPYFHYCYEYTHSTAQKDDNGIHDSRLKNGRMNATCFLSCQEFEIFNEMEMEQHNPWIIIIIIIIIIIMMIIISVINAKMIEEYYKLF